MGLALVAHAQNYVHSAMLKEIYLSPSIQLQARENFYEVNKNYRGFFLLRSSEKKTAQPGDNICTCALSCAICLDPVDVLAMLYI